MKYTSNPVVVDAIQIIDIPTFLPKLVDWLKDIGKPGINAAVQYTGEKFNLQIGATYYQERSWVVYRSGSITVTSDPAFRKEFNVPAVEA